MSSKPRFVGEKVKLGELLLNTFSGEWGTEEGELLTPVLRTSNFNEDGSLNYSTPAMRCIPEGKVAKKRMVRGDIILEKSGGTPKRPVGIMAFYDSDALALCSNFNQVLRFDESRILPRFAFHQLRWLKDRNAFDRYTRKTTGLQNLQMKKLIELKLRVPQIEAQTSIATTLDEIVCDQRTLQQEIACLDSLVKSRFAEMFLNSSWPIATIGECSMDIHYGTSEKASTEGEYVYLRMNNMGDDGSLDLSDIKRITLEGKALSNCLVRKGDLLFNRTNSREKVGKTCVFCLDEPMVIAGYIIRVRLDDRVDSTYLAAYMNLSSTKALLRGMAKGAVHQANINAKQLASIKFPLADIKAQKEFVSFVSQVDKSRFIAQQQIEKLQMLYDSLAQDYFGD